VEVAPVDQRDVDRGAPQRLDGLEAAEAAADHDDAVPAGVLCVRAGHRSYPLTIRAADL
jgi:hypothetical protein